MSNDLRNATASWSWYLHQWKVGIFVALKEIVRLLDEWKSIENWRIIYENAEDFDIQENDWTDFIVKSRHQVKANKDKNSLNDYKSVIEKTIYWSNWNLKTGFEIKKAIYSDKFLHVIKEVNWFNLKRSKFIKKFPRNNFIENYYKIKLYTYWKQKYCKLSSIEDNYLKSESLKLIRIIRPNIEENVYLEILFKLDEEIRDKHLNGWYPELSFIKIHEIIESYITFEELEDVKLRRRFVEYYDFFKSWIKENEVKNIHTIIWEIIKLDIDDFIKIIHEIHPNKIYSENWFDLNEDWLDEIFFECLAKIDKNLYEKYNFFIKDEERFFLSTINNKKSKIWEVVSKIIENSQISGNIYESDYLINWHIDSWNFSDYIKTYWGEEEEKEKEVNNSYIYSGNCKNETIKDKIKNTNLSFVTADDTIIKINSN